MMKKKQILLTFNRALSCTYHGSYITQKLVKILTEKPVQILRTFSISCRFKVLSAIHRIREIICSFCNISAHTTPSPP